MKTMRFYKTNHSDDILQIQTEGCIVNIRVNLRDRDGREITHVEILPDRDRANTEPIWELDGVQNNRVIKRKG